MKKIFKTLFIVSIISALFLITNCEEPEPPRPACEVNGTGDVKIINYTGIMIVVDVYDGGYRGERYVANGNSTTYYDVDAGSIEIWEKDSYSDWGYWTKYLNECTTFEFTLTSKKSGKDYKAKK